LAPAVAGVTLAFLMCGAPAGAATSGAGLYLTGAGSGHGVGMSQYGAAGYALHGASYQEILRDYYTGTTLGHVDPTRTVTVLLRAGGSAVFSGATKITGSKLKLNPLWTYNVLPAAGGLRLLLGRKLIGKFAAPLQVGAPTAVKLDGLGLFRGALVFRPSPGGRGVMTVNSVGLDDYVRGVVAAEMPPSWPAQALDAQAVAARSYAITSHPIGADFDVYDSTRSQVYEGIRGETPTGDAAVAATSGQVVEYAGAPVQTLFFASSGGETESVQNVFPLSPAAWLVGRPDPYDDALNDPYHQWKLGFSLQAAQRRLGKFVEGSLIGIRVLQRGISPRIITAKVVGTKGSVTVTGLQLRTVLDTPSTWMSFRTVSSRGVLTSTTPTSTGTVPVTTTDTGTTTNGGGGLLRRDRAEAAGGSGLGRDRAEVAGTIFPASPGARLTVQRRAGGRWRTVGAGRVARAGRYSIRVQGRGEYRVRFRGVSGPAISVR
jgi:stage II sporulation protein D